MIVLQQRAHARLAGCGFPTAHWLTLFDAASGLLVKQLAAPMRTHDMPQVAQLHSELRPGDVLVGDKAFASYAHLALISRAQLHGVFRAHQRQLVSFRQDRKLVGKQPKGTVAKKATSQLVRKLGKYDQVVKYRRPAQRPSWLSAEEYAKLPEEIVVREVRYRVPAKHSRTREITLVTTLLDSEQYPADALAELYGMRWCVETNLGHLKTTMGMDVLSCKTVAGVRKELAIYTLVYNLVRLTMLKASAEQQTPVKQISFVDALRWLAQSIQEWTPLRVREQPARPDRLEPRVRKRRPKQYDLMRLPRCQLRERIASQKVAA